MPTVRLFAGMREKMETREIAIPARDVRGLLDDLALRARQRLPGRVEVLTKRAGLRVQEAALGYRRSRLDLSDDVAADVERLLQAARTGSLLAPVVAHTAINAVNLPLLVRRYGGDEPPST